MTAEATAFAAQFWDRKTPPPPPGLAKIQEICPCPQTGGMSALMGSQPCLKKGMLTMTAIQNKNG